MPNSVPPVDASPRLGKAGSPPGSVEPARREFAAHTYFSSTKSLCATCKRAVEARIHFREGAVWLLKHCPEHGPEEHLIASSAEWYQDCLSFLAPSDAPRDAVRPVAEGCPFDCGPCAQHQQRAALPVVPITSACNLDCPICYTINRNEGAYTMTRDELAAIVARLRGAGGELDIINFTGGEPTLHPELLELLADCKAAGIRRLTLSTNGLRLRDEALVQALAAVDARVVLSLDTLRPEVDRALVGANTVKTKLAVLDLLEKHDVACTLLPAVARGFNDDELGELLGMVLARRNLRSLEIHPVAFTGQGGAAFGRAARITIPDLHARLSEATDGRIAPTDFVPSPLAHPHCYSICYLLCLDGGGYVPFTRFLGRAKLYELLQPSLYLEPREELEAVFEEVIDELWADPGRLSESERVLSTLRRLLLEVFPPGETLPLSVRQRRSERIVKAIYIHSHMDEETFDVGRVMRCCVAVPGPDGSSIPTCSYNVLYRGKDSRFVSPDAPLSLERRGERACVDAPGGGSR